MENRSLKSELVRGDAASRLIFGVSELAEALRNQLRMISRIEGSVLIEAAPGSGVSKVAEVLHLLSDRVAGPFVKRAAAELRPDGLSAAIEDAQSGSLFLDEISLLPVESQFALQEELDRGTSARVIAGTARSLGEDAEDGSFNADLFYRLEALRIRIPSLKERPEDIPVLFRHYVTQACEQAGIPEREIGSDQIARLMARDWPGNARALMNAAMQFALGLETGDERELGLAEKMAQIESSILIDALRLNRGNASATAEQLKVPRKTLYDKFTKYGIRPEDYR
jgi:two-component system C4-dicarboxylate transport response regulator DctD